MHRLVVALVTLITLTGATFLAAYLFLFSASADRAAALAPARTAFYLNLYLQPSTGQQMNLAGLMGRFPGFADEATLDDKVDQIVQNVLSGSGVDYRTDLKPWLGDQVALAAWPDGADPSEAEAVLIAEVKDRDAAEAAVARMTAEAEGSFRAETYGGVELQVAEGSAYAFVEEMLVIGDDVEGLRAVVDTTGGGEALAERADFRSRMQALPADHLASAFIDLAAIARATGVEDEFDSFSTASGVLVAERDGLRVSGSAPRSAAEPSASPGDEGSLASEPSTLVEWMPADTLAEIVVFDLRQRLEDAEAAVEGSPEAGELANAFDTARGIAAFALGIDLDADVLPLLDDEVGLAVGRFDGELPSVQLLLRPSDPDGAAAALERIAARLTAVGATQASQEVDEVEIAILTLPDVGEVSYALVEGVVILGLGVSDVTAAIDAHTSGASLSTTDDYRLAFELAGTRAGTEAYVDVGAIVGLMGDGAGLPDDVRDILSRIGSFGLTVPARDDQIEFHAVLTVDEP